MKTLLRAAWVAPMDHPPLRDAAVVISSEATAADADRTRGTILAVGEAAGLRASHPDAAVEDLGDCVLLPGLVNAHTHLELSHRTAGESCPTTFEQWLLGARREQFDADNAVAAGVRQCLRFGVTAVGDISQQSHLTRPLLRRSPLRCVSFGEALGLGAMRARFEMLLDRAMAHSFSPGTPGEGWGEGPGRLRLGISPHAPYTVDLDGYRRCVALAKQRTIPLATHLAESPHEREFLEDHAGPFRRLWEQVGSWREPVPTFSGSPIRMAHEIGLLDLPAILAHVNYCDDDELDLLAAGRASVVFCPRTHRYFGHSAHRWREMRGRGINLAIGTDSLASSPDLNPVEDLRLLHEQAPDVPAAELWSLVTMRGARALGCQEQIGTIAPGRCADLVAFSASGDDPLTELLESDALPSAVWIGGWPAN